MSTEIMKKPVQYSSVGIGQVFDITLGLSSKHLYHSVYLDESNGGCREIIFNDFLEDDEVREKQLLGVDLGKSC